MALRIICWIGNISLKIEPGLGRIGALCAFSTGYEKYGLVVTVDSVSINVKNYLSVRARYGSVGPFRIKD